MSNIRNCNVRRIRTENKSWRERCGNIVVNKGAVRDVECNETYFDNILTMYKYFKKQYHNLVTFSFINVTKRSYS